MLTECMMSILNLNTLLQSRNMTLNSKKIKIMSETKQCGQQYKCGLKLGYDLLFRKWTFQQCFEPVNTAIAGHQW